MPRPRKLVINKYLSDQEVGELQGKWIDETYIKHPIINYNCDVYYIDDNKEEKLLLKFRKNSIKNNLIRKGWHSYKDLAKPSRGRGASAGPIDTDSIYWKKRNIINTSKWSTGYLNPKGNKIKEDISNLPIEDIRLKLKTMDIKYSEDTADRLMIMKHFTLHLRGIMVLVVLIYMSPTSIILEHLIKFLI